MVCADLYGEMRIRQHAIRHIYFAQQLGIVVSPLSKQNTQNQVVLQVLNKRLAQYSHHLAYILP
jgi:hypothetical protein